MQRNSAVEPQVASALPAPASVRPDMSALASRADLVSQRIEASLLTLHRPGTPEGELLQRALAGENVRQAASRLGESRGLVVSGETLANLEEYQRWHFLVAPRVAPSAPPVFSQVNNPGLDRHDGVYATPGSGRQATQLTAGQLRAVDEFRSKVNSDLGRAAAVLGELEAHPDPGDPRYYANRQTALAHYQRLRDQVEPSPVLLGLGESRAVASARLTAIRSDQELSSRITPDLIHHYESVARAGGPVTTPPSSLIHRFAGRSDASLLADLGTKDAALRTMSTPDREAAAREVAEIKRELAWRAADPGLGAGVPRPAVEGRFAGMERDQDLPLRHDLVLQVALLAEPGPNAERLVAEMRQPAEFPGLDQEALVAMHQARQAELDRHQEVLGGIITAPPAAGPTLAERSGGQFVDADLMTPVFQGDGPAGLPPPDGMSGDGPNDPGGPLPTDVDPNGSRRTFVAPVVSPETHGAQELIKQIQEAERAAAARIRQESIFTWVSAAGAVLTASVAIAAEVGTAPMNPHADPGKALNHAATALNTVTLGMGQHLRQKVHERTKADSDIRAAIETYTREQRSNAEIWAEKMSNQMDHLDHLVPPAGELDRLERSVAASLLHDHGFRSFYKEMRDINAYDIHLAAAQGMIQSDSADLQQAGLRVAQSINANPNLRGSDWKTLQSHIADLGSPSSKGAVGGPLVGAYESFLKELEKQFYAETLRSRTTTAISTALTTGQLGELLGDEARSRALLEAAASTDPQDSRPPAQMLLGALQRKHEIERSIQDSWRDFAARSPLHAERVIHGGMDPATLLAHLYGRRSITNKSPDRIVAEGLRDYFQHEAQHRTAQGNQAERRIELGIPRGWGEHTLAGAMVGVSPSQNGSTQAMLLGFKVDKNQLDQAAIHLFAREGVGHLPAATLAAQGLSPAEVAAIQGEPTAPAPHAQLVVNGDLVRQLPVDRLASRIALDYNLAVREAYTEQAERQLDADAMAFAGLRTSGAPNPPTADLDMNEFWGHVDSFKAQNRNAYLLRAETLAARESIQAGGVRAMATQLKECQTMGGFNQVMEGNRGHFSYPPQRATLDRDPRVAMEGRSGERAGRDLQRVLNQADNSILALSNEFKQAREKGLKIAKDPNILYKMSPKAAQLAACLDTPFRQSTAHQSPLDQMRTPYDAGMDFLARRGYATLGGTAA